MFKLRVQGKKKRKRRLGEAWYKRKKSHFDGYVEFIIDIKEDDLKALPFVYYLTLLFDVLLIRYFKALLRYQDKELEKIESKLDDIVIEIYEQIAKNQIRPP